jgi:type IV pilus assembly protein PilY1
MKNFRAFGFFLMLSLLGSSFFARADDIDIYSDNSGTSGTPNVLLVLDNSASFSASAQAGCTYVDGSSPSLGQTAGGIEQCAIYNVVSSLPEGAVNIGVMVYNDNKIADRSGSYCRNSNGGCLVSPLTLMSGTAKTDFLAWIKSWKADESDKTGFNIKTSGQATGAVMQEAWAYYAGKTGLSTRTYTPPPAGCQKNFVIFIGNAFGPAGSPGEGGSASPQIALSNAPGVTSDQLKVITIPSGSYGTAAFSCGNYTMGNHTDSSGLYADEWARYMYQTDIYGALDDKQGITTYTVGLLGNACKPDYPALLGSMAKHGGGKYFATSSYDEISTAILKILNDVQAVNSVFSSASLPVSVNAQGTYLNQIFLGMFRPDASASPRWLGNLKQYQFILEYPDPTNPDPNKATLRLGDSTGAAAISNAGTGFIASSAISYWTTKNTANAPDSTGGFFKNDAHGAGGAYDSPDGELVEKGGAAQVSRKLNLTVDYASTPASPRNLYTYCPSGSGCNASLSDSSNVFAITNSAITDAMLSASSGISVSSIVRTGTTVTVTTTQNHGFSTGDSVTINGANQSEYNGTKSVITKIDNTHFKFTVPEYPLSPASGIFTASIPGAAKAVSSITRSGTVATVTLPAHGFVTGQSITFAGATQPEYNGTSAITVIDANSFKYAVAEGPATPAGGGAARVGSKSAVIAAYNANPTPGVVRVGTTVTVATAANHGFSTGNLVSISGVADPAGALIGQYNIGPVALVKTGNKSFTYTIPATTPANPATGTITADGSTSPVAILSLTRTGNVVTATTTTPHGFFSGASVSIGGTPGTNEGGYVGSFAISGVTATSFQYNVVTTPLSPATGTITVQNAANSDRTALINWVRGEDNVGDEASPGSGYTVRPSIHGDVLHSRPVVVNYGDSRGLVVFYGANDGVFRAVNGSQTGSLGSVPPGGELWGLVLPEFFGKLNRQRINSPELKMPSTALPGAQPKDYFVDGSPGVYQKLKTDGTVDKAYLYLIMRRGGRFIYAMDVSDPAQPQVMWKISASDTGFGELGQTWSRPRLTVVKGYANPVLVFGAGYDQAEDAQPPTADTMGRGIFVVDAVTGARVWSAAYTAGSASCSGTSTQGACAVPGMKWAIPADVTFLDRDNDGKTDRFYAADLGGNVWRVDLEPTAGITPDHWRVSQLAALGCDAGTCASGTTPRKFFFPPNVVSVGALGLASSYDAVMLGSGDREHPLISTATGSSHNVVNRFYVLKDIMTGKTFGSATTLTEPALFDATSTTYNGTLSGFYTTFTTGEKAVNASTTTKGTTFFGTNRPLPKSENSCRSNLGEAKGYALNPFTGTFNSTIYDGGGLPPTPITGIVNITMDDGSTVQKEFCVGCAGGTGADSKSALGAGDLNTKVPKNLRRTYWYKK